MQVRILTLAALTVGMLMFASSSSAVLLVHYDMNGDAVNQANPGTYDGAVVNDTVFTGAGPSVYAGTAAVFDGTNDGISIGDVNELDSLSTLTVAMWFRRDLDNAGAANDTNHAVNNVLFANSGQTGNDNVEIGTEGNIIEVYLDTGGGGSDATRFFDATALGGIRDGVWYHLAVTFDAAANPEGSVYLNGELVGQNGQWNGADLDNATDVPASLGIARLDRGDPWGDFNGAIDEFRLYTNALSQSEVRALVPEPATAVLGMIGVAGLAMRRRRLD